MEIPQKVSDFAEISLNSSAGEITLLIFIQKLSQCFSVLLPRTEPVLAVQAAPPALARTDTGHLPWVTRLRQGREGCDPDTACDAPNHRFHQSNHRIQQRGVSVPPVLLTHEQLMECEGSTDSTRAARSCCGCSCDRVCRETAAGMLCNVQATVSLQRSCAMFFCHACGCFSKLVPLLKLIETVSLRS